MTFARRRIKLTVSGTKIAGLTEEGLKTSVLVAISKEIQMGTADVLIYGLTLDTMNQLATFGQRVTEYQRNTLIIEAGDDVNGMSEIFRGTITQAWPDFQGAPLVPFHILAQAGLLDAMKPVEPMSFDGSTDVATILKKVQGQMDEVSLFENHGVNVKLDSPYLWGSPRNMVKQIAAAAGISWVIDRNVLAIMPQNKARGGGGLLVAPETGMVSYPGFTAVGVLVKQEFSRALSYRQKFTVKSDIVPACRDWMINRLEYDLESEVPKGHWFVTIEGIREGQGPTVSS